MDTSRNLIASLQYDDIDPDEEILMHHLDISRIDPSIRDRSDLDPMDPSMIQDLPTNWHWDWDISHSEDPGSALVWHWDWDPRIGTGVWSVPGGYTSAWTYTRQWGIWPWNPEEPDLRDIPCPTSSRRGSNVRLMVERVQLRHRMAERIQRWWRRIL
jgi:hypothetical protein